MSGVPSCAAGEGAVCGEESAHPPRVALSSGHARGCELVILSVLVQLQFLAIVSLFIAKIYLIFF